MNIIVLIAAFVIPIVVMKIRARKMLKTENNDSTSEDKNQQDSENS